MTRKGYFLGCAAIVAAQAAIVVAAALLPRLGLACLLGAVTGAVTAHVWKQHRKRWRYWSLYSKEATWTTPDWLIDERMKRHDQPMRFDNPPYRRSRPKD